MIMRLAMLCVLLAAPAAAQTASPARWRSTPASLLKSTLRSVAAAQTRHLAARGTYADAVAPLDLTLDPAVRVEILAASRGGWQARATHHGRPGRSCVIFVGRVEGLEAPRTDGDRQMAGEAGIPLCDTMR